MNSFEVALVSRSRGRCVLGVKTVGFGRGPLDLRVEEIGARRLNVTVYAPFERPTNGSSTRQDRFCGEFPTALSIVLDLDAWPALRRTVCHGQLLVFIAVAALTETQIDEVVDRYKREMARFENACKHVENRLRREFRAAAVNVLLASRAKHPEDLREKLRRKADDERYLHSELLLHLDHIVTDAAGCRVVLYDPRLEPVAAEVVQNTFSIF